MDLKVPYTQITDKKTAYNKACELIPEVIAKFGVKASIDKNDANCSLKAKGSGFEAAIAFTDNEAQVSVDLGFMLKPFKSKILETLEHQIKKVI